MRADPRRPDSDVLHDGGVGPTEARKDGIRARAGHRAEAGLGFPARSDPESVQLPDDPDVDG